MQNLVFRFRFEFYRMTAYISYVYLIELYNQSVRQKTELRVASKVMME